MERLEPGDFQKFPISRLEHEHRYRCAAALAKGRVLDLACGIGYGAPILLGQNGVSAYSGMDVAEDAIETALRSRPDRAQFMVGSALALPFKDGEFDTIVSMETLEHLASPAEALGEFRRVLAPGGVLIGSVPTGAFENFCTRQYGPNPYHLQNFSAQALGDLLGAEFAHIRLFIARIGLAAGLYNEECTEGPFHHAVLVEAPEAGRDNGSYFFVAAQEELPADLANRLGLLLIGGSYFEAERIQLDRILAAGFAEQQFAAVIAAKDRLVVERDALVKAQDLSLQSNMDHLRQAVAQLTLETEARVQAQSELTAVKAALNVAQAELIMIKASLIWRMATWVAGCLRKIRRVNQ